MKKYVKFILGLILLCFLSICHSFFPLVKAAASAEKLDERIYYIKYKGNDGFAKMIQNGGCEDVSVAANYAAKFLSKGFSKAATMDPPLEPIACSTLTVKTSDDDVMMARNFDYPYGTALILHTVPKKGYEAITTFSTDFFGFGENFKPEGFANQYMSLVSLFFALDGLNEKGLAIACLDAGDKSVTKQNTDKIDLTTTTAIQYLLKNAADVEEALELLKNSDMNSDPGSAYHLSLSDATGRSVAVEYVDNEMVVTETVFVTNHYLCEEKFQVGLNKNDHRHEVLLDSYNRAGGIMSEEELTKTISSVTQVVDNETAIVGGTLWTMVMDLTSPSVTYYALRNFDKPFHFSLGE